MLTRSGARIVHLFAFNNAEVFLYLRAYLWTVLICTCAQSCVLFRRDCISRYILCMMFFETWNLKKFVLSFAICVHYLSISIDFERMYAYFEKLYVPGCTRYLSIRLDTPSVSCKVRFNVHTCLVCLKVLMYFRLRNF